MAGVVCSREPNLLALGLSLSYRITLRSSIIASYTSLLGLGKVNSFNQLEDGNSLTPRRSADITSTSPPASRGCRFFFSRKKTSRYFTYFTILAPMRIPVLQGRGFAESGEVWIISWGEGGEGGEGRGGRRTWMGTWMTNRDFFPSCVTVSCVGESCSHDAFYSGWW